MGDARLAFGLLLYLFVVSLAASIMANGMGYSGVETIGIVWEPNAPSGNSVLDSVYYFGQLFITMGAFVLYTVPEAICPLWLNAVLFKIEVIALVLSVVVL